ncbi:hypothetical protein AVEN_18821-1 [Araneus ventricosus]|uniref:ATP-dependent DNA helicase n=1 Tax=Araneus ventricosus TaxID=182803 RepID=A0A4Y2RFY5_ARAVE|nr:hypothetical protein AVEN_18821-1 [Araneus ventricosus]
MMHKHRLEAVNRRTLQGLRGNKDLMGGLIIVLAGDFRQTLLVIPKGTMADEINACLKSSYLWKQLMPYVILKIFGNIPGLTGLCIAGIFSASLGTLSSAVNALANVTVEDFIKPFCFCKKVNDTWMAFIAKLLG